MGAWSLLTLLWVFQLWLSCLRKKGSGRWKPKRSEHGASSTYGHPTASRASCPAAWQIPGHQALSRCSSLPCLREGTECGPFYTQQRPPCLHNSQPPLSVSTAGSGEPAPPAPTHARVGREGLTLKSERVSCQCRPAGHLCLPSQSSTPWA